jgi:DNA phosphorothioation-dependent restriction protein DptG
MIDKQLQKYREEQDNLVSRQMAVIDSIRRHKTDLVNRRHGKTIETDVVRMIDENRDERDAAIFEYGQ